MKYHKPAIIKPSVQLLPYASMSFEMMGDISEMLAVDCSSVYSINHPFHFKWLLILYANNQLTFLSCPHSSQYSH